MPGKYIILKALLLFALLGSSLLLCSQVYTYTDTFPLIKNIYTSWQTDRPYMYRNCSTFFYTDKIDTNVLATIRGLFEKDQTFPRWTPYEDASNTEKTRFTLEERAYILKQINDLWKNTWQPFFLPGSKLIPFHSLKSMLKETAQRKSDPDTKICKEVYSFSKPFFLRNNSLCIFYTGKTNIFTHEGELWLYRKERGRWNKYSQLHQWVEVFPL